VRTDLSPYHPWVAEIAALERTVGDRADAAIQEDSRDLRDRLRAGEPAEGIRTRLFALAREAARRTLGLRPFDEQVLAALAMDDGHVVEMQTGEGKTLAAVLPAALGACAGRGAHVLTFNDYLARRDAEWMGPVYERLGLSVGYVQQGMAPAARRAAYAADVTYVTAKEAGFDRLRDLLAMDPAELVHRPFAYALVDEADSLMIDEARVPLVIAGSIDRERSRAQQLAALVASLTPGVHFDSDEYARDVELTETGIQHVEEILACGDLHRTEHIGLLAELNCALHARVLLRRDVDYIVRNGRIEIVDEFTGRVVPDRHWPDGLQAALEAKEGLEPRAGGRILGSLTLQAFLRSYPRLCGMTGTAVAAAEEIHALYGLEVVVIPPHRPVVRRDRDDIVYTHRDAKEQAVVEDVRRSHAAGRPVLVGTATVTESERLAGRIRDAGIPCTVLNAKNDADEAAIVACAGEPGAVTISTNMAGRGTDIRLGGGHETHHAEVAAAGGLYVIGTNRHESRRVDQQLRGRAGRQGDPGESRFFVSLDDDLLVRYGIRNLIPERFLPARSGEPVDHPIVRREIARAQRIIEGQDLEIRRTLAQYAAVVEEQHRQLAEWRMAVLLRDDDPGVWHCDEVRRDALVGAAGEEAVIRAERAVTLSCIDAAWRDHLAFCADLREGIHLVRLGGRDPLTFFTSEAIRAFDGVDERIEDAVLRAMADIRISGGGVDVSAVVKRPASTWTYLVNDDPFRNRIGAMLTGPGGVTIAMYSAAIMMPLLIAWGLIERLFGRRGRRRDEPFSS
jgi:preprotein translocase subunit SecA